MTLREDEKRRRPRCQALFQNVGGDSVGAFLGLRPFVAVGDASYSRTSKAWETARGRQQFLLVAVDGPGPTFYTFSERELQSGMAFAGLPDSLADLPGGESPREIITLAGADHMYTGVRDALAKRLIAWLSAQRDSEASS